MISAGYNTRVYEAQWTFDPNGESWSEKSIFPNSRSIMFTGPTRGKYVWVRVRAWWRKAARVKLNHAPEEKFSRGAFFIVRADALGVSAFVLAATVGGFRLGLLLMFAVSAGTFSRVLALPAHSLYEAGELGASE